MNNYFVDTHCHVFKSDYENIDEVLENASNNHIKYVINNGSNNETNKEVLDLILKYPNMYGAIGIHPEDVDGATQEDIKFIEDNLSNEKIVAIGEIGLDYYWDKDNKEQQKEFFERQLVLAKELKKPVIVHSREAALDTYEVIKASADRDNSGVIHCFSYSKEEAKKYLDMGFYIGIGGVLTFKKAAKIREVAEYVPIDRILLETDCPYLAPEPFRGKRNSSLYIPEVVKKIAEIKQLDYDEVIDITFKNGRRMYGI